MIQTLGYSCYTTGPSTVASGTSREYNPMAIKHGQPLNWLRLATSYSMRNTPMTAIGAVLLSTLVSSPTMAQRPVFGNADSISVEPFSIGFDAEVGLSVFENEVGDSERYFSSVFMPSVRKGIWQMGFMLKLRLNGDGTRDEDYNETRDYLSIIRYVQYSQKYATGAYARIGDLEEARLGYGQIVNDYQNTVSLDRPRLGLEFDFDSSGLRLESFVSDVVEIGPYGLRGAWRPFHAETGGRRQWAEFGLSIAGDLSRESRLLNPVSPGTAFLLDPDVLPIDSLGIVAADERSRPLFVSLDAALPFRATNSEEWLGYTTLTKMLDHGWGIGLGTQYRSGRENGRFEGQLEQRISFGEYLPSYFNALYEVDRIRDFGVTLEDGSTLNASNSKLNLLADRSGEDLGSFIAVAYTYRRQLRLKTSFEHSWNRSASGWFRIDVRFRHPDLMYVGRFSYDVVNVGSIKDIVSGPSNNTLFRIAFAYRFWEHLLLGARVRQSFEPTERNGRIVGQSKRTRFEPYFAIRI